MVVGVDRVVVPVVGVPSSPTAASPPADPAIRTGTERSVIVVLGEITQPPPTPATSSGSATAIPATDRGTSSSTTAVTTRPATTRASRPP